MGSDSSAATTVETPSQTTTSEPEQKQEEPEQQQQEEQTAEPEESDSIGDSDLEELRRKHRERFRMKMNMKREEFMALRNSNTLEDSIECMNKLGTCVNNIDTKVAQKQISDGINEKVLFVVVNTYEKPQYQLGVGPMNDAITVSMNHKKFGYKVVYLHNSTPTIFKKWLKFLLKNTEKDLTIFYTGHGCSIRDKNGDESDGYDEVLLFDNGYVVDDELADYLVKYAHGQRIVLLSDCCHSGSMWDIQSMMKAKTEVSPNIISISSAKDDQTAKQTKVEAKDQGIFSYYFWELMEDNPNISTKEMEAKINPLIGRFKQHFAYATTSPGMENEPMFPNRERKRRFRRGRGGRRGGRREEKE